MKVYLILSDYCGEKKVIRAYKNKEDAELDQDIIQPMIDELQSFSSVEWGSYRAEELVSRLNTLGFGAYAHKCEIKEIELM